MLLIYFVAIVLNQFNLIKVGFQTEINYSIKSPAFKLYDWSQS